MEVPDIVQEAGIKTIPKEKKCKNSKWLSEEALQIAVNRREVKGKGEKERYTQLNAEFQNTQEKAHAAGQPQILPLKGSKVPVYTYVDICISVRVHL